MSTDQTPALDRATDALVELDGRLELLYPEHLDDETVSEVSATIVSAALHDPDHPDWLAEALYRADYPLSPRAWDDLNAVTHSRYRQRADAVRAAILGADQ
jgi:hypothetical protein